MTRRSGVLFLFLLAVTLGVSATFAQMSIVNGASYDPGQPLAPGSFASMFGQDLCSQTMMAKWIAPGQLPTSLGDCSVTVNGVPAMMDYASPRQTNFIVPENVMNGTANVAMNNGSHSVAGSMMIARTVRKGAYFNHGKPISRHSPRRDYLLRGL